MNDLLLPPGSSLVKPQQNRNLISLSQRASSASIHCTCNARLTLPPIRTWSCITFSFSAFMPSYGSKIASERKASGQARWVDKENRPWGSCQMCRQLASRDFRCRCWQLQQLAKTPFSPRTQVDRSYGNEATFSREKLSSAHFGSFIDPGSTQVHMLVFSTMQVL